MVGSGLQGFDGAVDFSLGNFFIGFEANNAARGQHAIIDNQRMGDGANG